MNRWNVLVAALISFTVELSIVQAETILAPPASANIPVNVQAPASSHFLGTGGSRVQQVYDSSNFPGFGGPSPIPAISIRPITTPSAFFGNTASAPDSLIRLPISPGSGPGAGQLPTNFANNGGGDMQTVFSGALTPTTSASGMLPFPIDYTINLESPIDYVPSQGNLLLDVQIPSTHP